MGLRFPRTIMKFKNRSLPFAVALAGVSLPIQLNAAVSGLHNLQTIPMSPGSGEVVAYSGLHATIAVTDNPSGGVRLLRHAPGGFAPHAVVDFKTHFANSPIEGFACGEVTGVALDKGASGIGVATVLNASPVVVNVLTTVMVDVEGVPTPTPTVVPTTCTESVPQPGRAVFFNLATGAVLGSVQVGSHPDMVAIEGGVVAIANEGQHAWSGNEAAPGTVAEFDHLQQPGSVSVIRLDGLDAASLETSIGTLQVETRDFTTLPGISVLRDHTSFDPANTRPKHYHIEPEYVAFSPDGTRLFVTLQENNGIAVLDLATLTWAGVTDLGRRSLTIDASDSDDIADVSNPIVGLPMPDAIASWQQDGETYVITADEGDARVDDGDIQRFAPLASAFGLAEGFAPSVANNDYGRLNVLKDQCLDGPVFPGEGQSSKVARVAGLGTRGLSLWKLGTDGGVVPVSHLPLEAELITLDPQRHNANNGGQKNAFDARSDDKGPEPEAVAVTRLADGTVIAVVGMERQNGVAVIDLTQPTAPKLLRYINDSGRKLISPETVRIVDAAQSPTGNTLAIVGCEGIVDSGVAGGIGVYEINAPSFRLQVLHASDMEADTTSIAAAPRFAALVDKLEDTQGIGASVTIGAGDCFIPGAFLSAGNDPSTKDALKTALGAVFGYNATAVDLRESAGRPDIAILNAIGMDATCIGNHEWDLGATEFASIVLPDPRTSKTTMRHYGAAFPFLSANLDFSADATLNARFTSAIRNIGAFAPHPGENYPGLSAPATAAKLAKAAVIERGGEKIGVLGVSPPDLASISSPGLVKVTGPTGAVLTSPRTYDIDALAAHLQPTVDALVDAGCNKIILSTQLQQLENEKLLASKLRHVDIIVAGGSGSILAKPGTRLQPGDTAAGGYPFTTTDLDGSTVAVVSGEGQYQYLGRLVVDFDPQGRITAIDPTSDNVVVDAQSVADAWGSEDPFAAGTRGATVKAVADAVGAVISAKDGMILGKSAVYLEGRRTHVRQQETNFGNLSADANLWYARKTDPSVEVSIKNGGGIRNAIGSVDAAGGLQPTAANPAAGKNAGDISRLDVEDSLKFNNLLTLVTVRAADLKLLLEHGVAGSNGTGADKASPGQFCQIGGMVVVVDLAEPAVAYTASGSPSQVVSVREGRRIRHVALTDADGRPREVLVSNGVVLQPDRPVRLVTLNFLASASPAGSDFGGDSYPFPWLGRTVAGYNRVDLTSDASGNLSTFAVAGSEQDALAEYLLATHGSMPFGRADSWVDLDRRIIQGGADTDGDGLSNAFETAALALDPDAANTSVEISAAMETVVAASRVAGKAEVTTRPGLYNLYTAESIQELRGTGNLLVRASGGEVSLKLPVQKSGDLGAWENFGSLELNFPKTADKEFYRVVLPD